MLAHMSVSLILDDPELSNDEASAVLKQIMVDSGQLNKVSQHALYRFTTLVEQAYGLKVRYNRQASLAYGPPDRDDILVRLPKYERYSSLPKLSMKRIAKRPLGGAKGGAPYAIWRQPDALSRSFHIITVSFVDDVESAADAFRGGGADYPIYLSLGIGGTCDLNDGCDAVVSVRGIDAEGRVVLSGRGRGSGKSAEEAKEGILTNAIERAFLDLVSSPGRL